MKITIEVHIDAPLEIVWRAFNNPDDILRWDGSDEWQVIHASNDLRVGGSLRLRIHPKDGQPPFDFVATYTLVEPMRLVEWQDSSGRLARTEFWRTDTYVLVRQAFDGDTEIPEEEQRRDWQGVLDRFAQHVAKLVG